ncbi:DUF6044 family protein [bacterium]|nr:DUF6044 family protein [bacterium]
MQTLNPTDSKAIIYKYLIWSILWATFLSSSYYILGRDSYIEMHDNGDSNFPISYYAEHNIYDDSSSLWSNRVLGGGPASPFSLNYFEYMNWVGVDPQVTLIILVFLQRFLAAFFTFLLLYRFFGLSPIPAFIAGLVFSLNSNPQSYVIYHSLGVPGLSLIIYVFLTLLNKRTTILTLLFSLILGIFIAIHGSIIYLLHMYAIIFFWLYFIEKKSFSKVILLMFLAGIGILAIELYPALILSKSASGSFRLDVAENNVLVVEAIRIIKKHLLQYLKGDFLQVLAIPISILGIMLGSWRDLKFRKLLAGYLIFVFLVELLAFIDPLVKGFHLNRFYFFTSFWSAGAIAVSIEAVIRFMKSEKKPGKSAALLYTGIVGFLVFILSFGGIHPLYSIGRDIQLNKGMPGFFISEIFIKATFLALLLIIPSISIYLYLSKKKSNLLIRFILIFAVLTTVATGIGEIYANINQANNSEERYSYYFDNESYGHVRDSLNQDNLFRVGTFVAHELHPNIANYYGLETIDGYEHIFPAFYHGVFGKTISNVVRDVEVVEEYFREYGQRLYLFPPGDYRRDKFTSLGVDTLYDFEILSLMNTRYFFSAVPVNSSLLIPIDSTDGIFVYENPDCFSRVYFTPRKKAFSSIDEMQEYIANAPLDTLREYTFLLREDVKESSTEEQITPSEIEIVEYAEDYLLISLKTLSPGFINISTMWSESWRATIDDREVPLYFANGAFMAVPCDSGKFEVELRFSGVSSALESD